jgi:hypothetical protein
MSGALPEIFWNFRGALILGDIPDGDIFNERFDLLRIVVFPRLFEHVGIERKNTI